MLSAMSLRLISEPSIRDQQRRSNQRRLASFRQYRANGFTPAQARHMAGFR